MIFFDIVDVPSGEIHDTMWMGFSNATFLGIFTNIPDAENAKRKMYVKEWSWYRYFFSRLNEPTEQKVLVPYLGGTYPTSCLYYKRETLSKMVDLLTANPKMYNNIQF